MPISTDLPFLAIETSRKMFSLVGKVPFGATCSQTPLVEIRALVGSDGGARRRRRRRGRRRNGRSRRRRGDNGRGDHARCRRGCRDWAGVPGGAAPPALALLLGAGRPPRRRGRRNRSCGSRERQLLDERILALEEAERDQLARVAHDLDPVRVWQLAAGATGTGRCDGEAGSGPAGAMALGSVPAAAASGARSRERPAGPRSRRRWICFWRLTRFLASAVDGLRCSCSGGRRAGGCGGNRLRALDRRRLVGAARPGRDRRRRPVAEDVGGDGQRGLDLREGRLPWLKVIESTVKRRPGGVQDAVVDADEVAKAVEEVGEVVEAALEGEVDADLLVGAERDRIVRRDRLKRTPVSSATRLSWSITPGMSAVFGIARDEPEEVGDADRRRPRRRLSGRRRATVISDANAVDVCCFNVVASERLGAITANQPTANSDDHRRAEEGEPRGGRKLAHPVSPGRTLAWIENVTTASACDDRPRAGHELDVLEGGNDRRDG